MMDSRLTRYGRPTTPHAPIVTSADCWTACLAAHQAHDGNASQRGDALVRRRVDTFVSGSETQCIERGTQLMRHAITSGLQHPSAAASTWCATLSRLSSTSEKFARARSIMTYRQQQRASQSAAEAVTADNTRTHHAALAGLNDASLGEEAQNAALLESVYAAMRSVDQVGWLMSFLARHMDLAELRALDTVSQHPAYAVTLACFREGLGAGRAREAAVSDAAPEVVVSHEAERLMLALRCETKALGRTLARSDVDASALCRAFRTYCLPEIGRRLDAQLSCAQMQELTELLEMPELQSAYDKQDAAFPAAKQELTGLVLQAALSRPDPELVLQTCGSSA